MSQVYNLEPPTDGKIVLHTSFGDIDIELWPREAPLACRNFIQHALDGYYDKTIFHRVIPKFMIQGGDPTGVGDGGEAAFGRPFKDEFHSRLKFNHRGLLAMANANEKDANASQFFITLDSCEWLNKKHTIFGKVVGQTVFNLLRMGDVDTDANDRPVDAPRLDRVSVLINPYDDIAPRITQASEKNGGESEAAKRRKKRKKVNDRTLLSFGDDDEMEADSTSSSTMKMASMHDLAPSTRALSDVAPEVAEVLSKDTLSGGHATGKEHTSDFEGSKTAPAPLSKEEAAKQLRLAVGNSASSLNKDKNSEISEFKKSKRSENADHDDDYDNEEDEDYKEMQQRMKEQQRRRREKHSSSTGAGDRGSFSGDRVGSKRSKLSAGSQEEEAMLDFDQGDNEEDMARTLINHEKEQTRSAIELKRQEYKEAKSAMRAASARDASQVIKNAKSTFGKGDNLLTPLQQQREAFLKRTKDKDLQSRQQETLAALAAFSSNLNQTKQQPKKQKDTDRKDDNVKEDEESGYHGQVTENDPLFGDDEEDEGGDWFSGKLKFKKHVDDFSRSAAVGGDGRSTDDYMTLDAREVDLDAIDNQKRLKDKLKQDKYTDRQGYHNNSVQHERRDRERYEDTSGHGGSHSRDHKSHDFRNDRDSGKRHNFASSNSKYNTRGEKR